MALNVVAAGCGAGGLGTQFSAEDTHLPSAARSSTSASANIMPPKACLPRHIRTADISKAYRTARDELSTSKYDELEEFLTRREVDDRCHYHKHTKEHPEISVLL
ncbi:hypothetical protein LTR95_009988 [Oleoguttula sp. CCFEE 5521]